ncbi:MAG: hypothetical protein ACE14M_08630 [Terriglobales bacterium]
MKARLIVVIVLVCGAMLWAQSTTPQTPPASTQTETGAGAAKSTKKAPGRTGKSMAEMQAMRAEHMQQMKADVQKMHTLLDQMKSDVAKMDSKDQPAMQANIEMWQTLVNHMDRMVQHMSEMPPPGKGGKHMHRRGGIQGGPPPSSETAPPSTGTPPPK